MARRPKASMVVTFTIAWQREDGPAIANDLIRERIMEAMDEVESSLDLEFEHPHNGASVSYGITDWSVEET